MKRWSTVPDQIHLTLHEGPGRQRRGYIKASGEPTIVMRAAVVGMSNAIGQMIKPYKEQTPLVVTLPHRSVRRAGRDSFEEVPNQEQICQPFTKYLAGAARRHGPETVGARSGGRGHRRTVRPTSHGTR
jgi:hypothetical protein